MEKDKFIINFKEKVVIMTTNEQHVADTAVMLSKIFENSGYRTMALPKEKVDLLVIPSIERGEA